MRWPVVTGWRLWGRLLLGHGVHAVAGVGLTLVVAALLPDWAATGVVVALGVLLLAGVLGRLDLVVARVMYRSRPASADELTGLGQAIVPLCAAALGPPVVRYEVAGRAMTSPAAAVGSIVVVSREQVVQPALNRTVPPGWVRQVIADAAGQTTLPIARGVSLVMLLALPTMVAREAAMCLRPVRWVVSMLAVRIITGPVLVGIMIFSLHLTWEAAGAAVLLVGSYAQPWARRTWHSTVQAAGHQAAQARLHPQADAQVR